MSALIAALPGVLLSAPDPARAESREQLLPVTYTELALAFIRFEQALLESEAAGEDLVDINRRFDRATRHYFSRRLEPAFEELNALAARLQRAEDERWRVELSSVRATFSRDAWILNDGSPSITITAPSSEIESLTLEMVRGRRVIGERDLTLQHGHAAFPIDEIAGAPGPGPIVFRIRPSDAPSPGVAIAHLSVFARSPDAQITELRKRVEALSLGDERAGQIIRDRLEAARPDRRQSSLGSVTQDPSFLLLQIEEELEELESGRDPYRNRAGDYLRPLRASGTTIPARVFVPETDDPERERPLIVALHGASVDQNMFFDGYGRGAIKRAALTHDAIIAAPLTYTFAVNTSNLTTLLEDLSTDYRIDRSRVVMIGHSLGAVSALGFASDRREDLRRVVCLAGFRPIPVGTEMSPVRVYLAEHDYIFSPARVRPFSDAALESGAPIQIITIPDQGHTLIVPQVLDEAIAWLLAP